MKNNILCGMIVGCFVGATIVTFCKPAQNIIKKGTKMIKEETKNIFIKSNEEDE